LGTIALFWDWRRQALFRKSPRNDTIIYILVNLLAHSLSRICSASADRPLLALGAMLAFEQRCECECVCVCVVLCVGGAMKERRDEERGGLDGDIAHTHSKCGSL